MKRQSTFVFLIVFIIAFSFFACGCHSGSSDDHYQTFYPWAIPQKLCS